MAELNQAFPFGSKTNRARSWISQITSFVLHIVAGAILLLIPAGVTRHEATAKKTIILVAPSIRSSKPKMQYSKVEPPKPLPELAGLELPVSPPKATAVHAVEPPVLRQAPQPQQADELPSSPPRVEISEAPPTTPRVHSEVVGNRPAGQVQQAKRLNVGGFGDPNGVLPSPEAKANTHVAKLGSFELSPGDGNAGGAEGQAHGQVRRTGFDNIDTVANGPAGESGRSGTLKTGGFKDSALREPVQIAGSFAKATTTPVEILFKPKPSYTQEARDLKIEGEVALEVVFSADGTVKVIRIIQGLGHGLDKSAELAATQIRFRPSTRDGIAIDTRATVRITFELT